MLKRFVIKKAVKPVEKRQWIQELISHYQLSIRQACATVDISGTVFYYTAKINSAEAKIMDLLDQLTTIHPTSCFLKCYHMIRRAGHLWNRNRV